MQGFFAILSRMKYVSRWGLMRNTRSESLSEHSMDVAVIAHALCVIGSKLYGRQLNPERAAVLSLFHDATEILTGDLPTPVKYFNPEIKNAYKAVESSAAGTLTNMLPDVLRDEYAPLLSPTADDKEIMRYVKAADKISALIKCVEEEKAGNAEFSKAKEATLEAIKQLNLPEADYFVETFMPSFALTLDELK